jgi:4-hydroxymandelate oxidase
MTLINVSDFEQAAKQRVEASAWDYIQGGSGDETTLRRNRAAFEEVVLRPRVLRDVHACDLTTRVLGATLKAPILVAPVGLQMLVHPEGEEATARGAAGGGSLMIVSTMSSVSVEKIGAAAGGPFWYQVYVFRDREQTIRLIRRAEAAGASAIVVTVDVPRLGNRDRDARNGFSLPSDISAVHVGSNDGLVLHESAPGGSAVATHVRSQFDPGLTWEVIDWLRQISHLPILLKGIMTAEDAKLAAERGVDGVIVSNHGGRQLDGVSSTIEVLPEVVDAVQGRCEVLLDGGVRRGTDILKALALGARAVLVGRPILWGLAVDGETGVRRVLELLGSELELAMALCGQSSVARLDPALARVRSTAR